LVALQTTQSLLDRTSLRLSTGLKVNTPLDDAFAFFAAQALTFQAGSFERSQRDIEQASQALAVSVNAIQQISKLVQNAQGLLSGLSTATSSAASGALTAQYNALISQIDVLASDAAYQGINLLNNATTTLGVSFSGVPGQNDISINAVRSDSGGLFLSTIATNQFFQAQVTIPSQESRQSTASIASIASIASRASVAGTPSLASQDSIASTASIASSPSTASQPSNATNSSVPSQQSSPSVASVASRASRESAAAVSQADSTPSVASVASVASFASIPSRASIGGITILGVNTSLISNVSLNLSNALSSLQANQSTLGSTNAILSVRLEFSKSYVATLKSGAAQLTVADLNEEGANLTSLQTAQQLGVVSLSITTQAQQSLLRLF
jgi:flagellin-like hook-associated protein FlgL